MQPMDAVMEKAAGPTALSYSSSERSRIAALLAGVGLYGSASGQSCDSHRRNRRSHVLGCSARQIFFQLVVGQGLGLTAIGIAAV